VEIIMRVIVCVLLAASCKPNAPAPASSRTAPVAAATPSDQPTMEREGNQGMTDELAREAGQRPSDTPTAEAVLDALEKNGIHIERRRQVPARPVEASYCVTGLLAGGASASVCEYPDAEAAARGKQVSMDKLKMMPRHEIFVNKKTTLAVMGPDDLAEKIQTIFAGL
jgi:hypothetical protein